MPGVRARGQVAAEAVYPLRYRPLEEEDKPPRVNAGEERAAATVTRQKFEPLVKRLAGAARERRG